jgi:hypothetical protein
MLHKRDVTVVGLDVPYLTFNRRTGGSENGVASISHAKKEILTGNFPAWQAETEFPLIFGLMGWDWNFPISRLRLAPMDPLTSHFSLTVHSVQVPLTMYHLDSTLSTAPALTFHHPIFPIDTLFLF